MITTISAGPQTEPVSLEDAKLWLKATALEDDLIDSLIVAARVSFEKYTGTFALTQTVTQRMDAFPCGSTLSLRKGPVQSVTSVKGYDAASSPTTLPPDQYVIDTAGNRIVLKDGSSWPAVAQVVAGAEVVYTAGYTEETIPAAIAQGMKHLISHMYENRETADQLPPVVEVLWSPFRVVTI